MQNKVFTLRLLLNHQVHKSMFKISFHKNYDKYSSKKNFSLIFLTAEQDLSLENAVDVFCSSFHDNLISDNFIVPWVVI